MRVLFWYCDQFHWSPAMKTLEDAPPAGPAENETTVVAFVHVEPKDMETGGAETKLVKNAKWLARKWDTTKVILHSFTHLGEEKAEPDQARELVESGLQTAGRRGLFGDSDALWIFSES